MLRSAIVIVIGDTHPARRRAEWAAALRALGFAGKLAGSAKHTRPGTRRRRGRLVAAGLMLMAALQHAPASRAESNGDTPTSAALVGTFGTERDDFEIDGRRAMMLKPIREAPDGSRPWIFCAPVFMGPHPTQPEVNPNLFEHPVDEGSLIAGRPKTPEEATHRKLLQKLLESGFHVGGIEVGESMGNPEGVEQYEKYYREVVRRYDLNPKACLYVTSRGALMHYNWAAQHPDQVLCIGANQPVIDLALFPGMEEAAKAYGMPLEEFTAVYREHNPIDNLALLAGRSIPIFHIVGEADALLPLEHQIEMRDRYVALGGDLRLLAKPGIPHGLLPELLEDMRMYEFFMEQAGLQ